MRKLGLLTLFLAGLAFAAGAGITLRPTVRFEFTNCSSSGSSAQTLTAGPYVFRATDEDVWFCFATTCSSGGERWPLGTVIKLEMPAGDVSCRSTNSTGDAIFTRGD